MAFVGLLFRLFAYAFHFALSVFLIGLAIVVRGRQTVNLDMVPGAAWDITTRLAVFGGLGLLTLLLALMGKVRWLYFLFALATLGAIVWGYFVNNYRFASEDEFRFALYLSAAALLALIGAWSPMRRKPKAR